MGMDLVWVPFRWVGVFGGSVDVDVDMDVDVDGGYGWSRVIE